MQVDHVIPEKHRGPTAMENLALTCYNCNAHKGPNLTGIDPETGDVTEIFNPRTNSWDEQL